MMDVMTEKLKKNMGIISVSYLQWVLRFMIFVRHECHKCDITIKVTLSKNGKIQENVINMIRHYDKRCKNRSTKKSTKMTYFSQKVLVSQINNRGNTAACLHLKYSCILNLHARDMVGANPFIKSAWKSMTPKS